MKDVRQIFDLLAGRARGIIYSISSQMHFRSAGRNFKLYGSYYMRGSGIPVGDNCWFEAVDAYKGTKYNPRITIGESSMFSNGVHISAVKNITIGQGCLFGSNIYIGDHSHGSTRPDKLDLHVAPAQRPLDDIGEIIIGERIWVGDGTVILAGTRIAAGSIIGANSVVKGDFPTCAIIAGAPAKVIRDLG